MFALVLAGSTVIVIGLLVAVCWNTRIIQDNNQMAVQIPKSQQSTPEPQVPETVGDQPINTVNWRDFVSRKCGFSFMYPSDGVVGAVSGRPIKAIDHCNVVSDGAFRIRPMYDPTPNIEVETFKHYNPKNLTPQQVKNWSAKQVAEEILEINKEDNRIRRGKNPEIPSYEDMQVEEIILNSEEKAYGYSFEFTASDWAGGSVEYSGSEGATTVVFIADNDGQMYQISFPQNSRIARKTLETLEFFK